MAERKTVFSDLKQTKKIIYKFAERDLEACIPYLKQNWGKQTDRFDRKTNFIYRAEGLDDILYEHNKNPFPDLHYTIRRYFNFVASKTIEDIFCSYNICEKEKSEKHKTIDFYIKKVPFDLKVSSFPRGFKQRREDYASDREYRNDLIRWLYSNQSKEGRYHEGNRLFILCKSGEGESQKENTLLKKDFTTIHKKIENYLEYINEKNLFNEVTLPSGQKVLSDVILINKQT